MEGLDATALRWMGVNMNEDRLRLQVASDTRDVNAEAFLKILGTTIDVLKEIDKQSSRFGGENIQWVISDAGKNSPIFAEIAGTRDNGHAPTEVIGDFVAGLEHLERHDTCPHHFNERTLDATAALGRTFSLGVTNIAFTVATHGVSLSRQIFRNAQRACQRLTLERGKLSATYKEHGTVEGRLRQLETLSGERRDKLIVEDDLTEEKIACYFRDDAIEQQARGAWKQRVSVSGEITVNRASGAPVSVLVDELRVLRERAGLPQMEDLYGIDIPGGMDSVEYVRRLRDGE